VLERVAQETLDAYRRAMDAFDLQQGAALVIDLAAHANRYIEEQAPWKLAKARKDAELDRVLATLVRTVARLAVLAAPFVPVKAQEIWRLVGAHRELAAVPLAALVDLSVAGWTVLKPPPLFPKPPDG
jgi:methionyl-tRNA synthetase